MKYLYSDNCNCLFSPVYYFLLFVCWQKGGEQLKSGKIIKEGEQLKIMYPQIWSNSKIDMMNSNENFYMLIMVLIQGERRNFVNLSLTLIL